MKIGICSSLKRFEKVELFGFDYIEPSVSSIADMSNIEFEEILKQVKKSKIKCEVFNGLFPKDMKILGDKVDKKVIYEYILKSFRRISMLGGEIVVFGSGASKKVPEGFDSNLAYNQLKEITIILGNEAAKYNLVVVIEPLCRDQCNIINNLSEGLKLVIDVNHSNIKLLADFYHMRLEQEKMNEIEKIGDFLRHIHIANSKNDRAYPLIKDEDIYQELFYFLKKIDYKGRISIEGKTNKFDIDATKSLDLLKNLTS